MADGRPKPIHKIRAAAYYFAFVSQDINRIATDFQVSTRTIRRWADDPIWTQTLDACGYLGDRTLKVRNTTTSRDILRAAGRDPMLNAQKVYLNARKAGIPKHKLAAFTEGKTGINRKKIGAWARKYGW